ncbi:MAG: EAL domain-containing protein [bacterium]
MPGKKSVNEAARLEALHQYNTLSTETEEKFADVLRLASQICRTPVALVSLVDKDRVYFKAARGLKVKEMPRDGAFCAQTILQKEPLTVEDARADPRFKRSPLVIAHPYARLYAGVPLITAAGDALGTLCVMDSIPRTLTEEQHEALAILGRQAMSLLEECRGQSLTSGAVNQFAYYDTITNLPNHELFRDRLQQALALSRRNDQMLGVMLISLDRFKTINDTLGYVAADRLLREVADRISSCVRECDTVARFGRDEFALLFTQLRRAEDAAKIAQSIRSALSSSFNFKQQELFVTSSMGISLFPYDAKDMVTLLKNAGTALNRAQEQDGNNYQFYTSGRTTKALKQLVLENNIRPALERGEFVFHYQPQVNMQTFQMVGMEALMRWQHPVLGLLYPSEFIKVAEESGLIVMLGDWAVRAACMQSKAWQDAGLDPLPMAVNLSPRQFQQPGLVETVGKVLKDTGLDPCLLELELTEGSLMKNPDEAIGKLHELKAMGVKISIDDFGTGYSSLSYLKLFPIDTLKIDQSFVNEINTDADDAAIVAAIISLAHALRLNVIAEGVETQEQLDHLQRLGCDSVQGFLFSKPLSIEDFTQLLVERLSLRPRKQLNTNPLPKLETVLQGRR